MLNDQFRSVFTEERLDDPPHLDSPRGPTLPDIEITTNGVRKLLEQLNPSKAAGADCIPARILKACAKHLAPVFTQLFQQTLTDETIPEDWRTANVAPVFKKSDRSQPANYRPVSLTSIICKIMEHIMVSNVMNHLETHNLLTDLQHGFRSKRSCETQLLITTKDLISAIDQGKHVDMSILDFSKAFDVVPHHRLMVKLEHYGIRGRNRRWIRQLLKNCLIQLLRP